MTNILTAEQVYDAAGISVDRNLIARAQLVLTVELGLDLGNPLTFAAFSAADQARVKSALVWQVVYLDAHPEVLEQVGNIVQASANGASVTYATGEGGDGSLAPLASRALGMLSWRRPKVEVKTLRPYAVAADPRGPQPDPWVTLG